MNEFIRDPSELNIEDLVSNRPTVGDEAPVILWRLVRLIGMHKILEEETSDTVYFIGKHIGKMLKVKNTGELQKLLTDLKIGKIDFPVNTENLAQVAISECITCAGIKPPLGRPICQLETGIVAGALENIYPGRKVVGEEIKCVGGLGEEVCLIECKII